MKRSNLRAHPALPVRTVGVTFHTPKKSNKPQNRRKGNQTEEASRRWNGCNTGVVEHVDKGDAVQLVVRGRASQCRDGRVHVNQLHKQACFLPQAVFEVRGADDERDAGTCNHTL